MKARAPAAEERAAAPAEVLEPSGDAAAPPPSPGRVVSVRPVVMVVGAVIVAGLVAVAIWPYWQTAVPDATLERPAAPETAAVESLAAPETAATEPPASPETAAAEPPAPNSTSIAVAELKAEGERISREMAGLVAQLSEVEMALRALRERADRGIAPATAGTSETRTRLARLTERLAALEAREISPGEVRAEGLAAVEREKAALMGEMAGLAERLAALEMSTASRAERLTALEMSTASHAERLAALETSTAGGAERLAALEAETASRAGRMEVGSRLVLAVTQLRHAVDRGVPYGAEIKAALALATENEEIRSQLETLASGAEKGIPTVVSLRVRFGAVAGEIVKAKGGSAGRDWVATAIDRLASVVSVRRVGEVSGEGADAIVARAEARLQAGDLAGAMAEVENLSGPAAASATGWFAEARRRTDAERALDAVQAALLAPGASSGS